MNKPKTTATPRFTGVRKIRVTYVVPETLDKNLEAYSLANGVRKQEALTEALVEYLQGRNMKPDQLPKISYSY